MEARPSGNDKVILLPRTVDYYQEQLTRLLETEQFGEAIRMLQFLLACRQDDRATNEEWQTLLVWLETSFAELTGQTGAEQADDEPDVTEADLHKQRFHAKMAEDPGYVKKLLQTLLTNPELEKKMMALEQLTIAEHPHLDDTLIRWVSDVDLHPLVQFKVLQTLRFRGVTGRLTLSRVGEPVELDIEETPLDMTQYPVRVQEVMDTVKDVSEADQPSLAFFADHMWKEFLAFVYGTSIYTSLATMEPADTRLWAAALHSAVADAMNGQVPLANVLELYKLAPTDAEAFNRHRETIGAFIRNTFMP